MSGGLSDAAADRLRRLPAAGGMPGFGLALSAPGRSAVFCHGEDWVGSNHPVGPDTWFQAASTGKHVMACLILDLASRGELKLEAPIGSYLPDVPSEWADRRVRSLLHHTSGLPEYLAYVEGETPPASRADFMALAASLPPIAPEGTSWSYSNSNYILLGFLAAEAGGEPAGKMMQDLFRRAGVAGARIATPDWVREANEAGYPDEAVDRDSLSREVIGDGDVAFTAAGALAWLERLVDGRAVPEPMGGELFAAAEAHDRPVPYGCGWFLEQLGDAALAHHAGHFDGWTAMAFLNLERRTGAIALSNEAPGTTRMIRALALEALEDFSPGSTPLSQRPIEDSRPDLAAIAESQLIRADSPAAREHFAPELQLAIDRGGPVRGIVNLWTGEPPSGFELVQERFVGASRMRRYRLTYALRTEHVSVGTTSDDRIHWAWPL